jgi:hypothetical protein
MARCMTDKQDNTFNKRSSRLQQETVQLDKIQVDTAIYEQVREKIRYAEPHTN